jgi:hypothetical protein
MVYRNYAALATYGLGLNRDHLFSGTHAQGPEMPREWSDEGAFHKTGNKVISPWFYGRFLEKSVFTIRLTEATISALVG